MARKRKRNLSGESGELNMTAMIDVVFQLLIFFLVTQKPIDTMANLDVFRPSPTPPKDEVQPPQNMIRIQVLPQGVITINDRTMGHAEMGVVLEKLAALSQNQTIMILCSAQSRHEDLVRVLDLCAKVGLVNLSVVSIN
ncbi:MAG: biopolymer transporter ExbD [Kiritimatiellae bacterium]|nr:biopolymer transporter ExbD [Kiritimatiellia bacterium]MCO5068302.1 biopolymer transporter ExbD [Kiritimatiellia bacterium]